MKVIGVDPGNTGAVAVVGDTTVECNNFRRIVFDPATIGKAKKPAPVIDGDWLLGVFERYIGGEYLFALERVNANPTFGSKGSFTFGRACGQIISVMQVLGIQPVFVSPRKWKQEYGLVSDRKKGKIVPKEASIDKILEFFPDAVIDNHNQADAALIAHYVRRKTLNGDTI